RRWRGGRAPRWRAGARPGDDQLAAVLRPDERPGEPERPAALWGVAHVQPCPLVVAEVVQLRVLGEDLAVGRIAQRELQGTREVAEDEPGSDPGHEVRLLVRARTEDVALVLLGEAERGRQVPD